MDKLYILTETIIEKLKAAGADMAYCTASSGETREFNVDGGEFSLFRTLFDNSLTITAFIGGKKGTVGLNSFDDDKVDELFVQVRTLLARQIVRADSGEGCIDLLMIAKYFERIGDHAVNIAEWVDYSLTGHPKDLT